MGQRKDSVSLNARIGSDMFHLLERYCDITGQPKTVAVERAIRALCAAQPVPNDMPSDQKGGVGT